MRIAESIPQGRGGGGSHSPHFSFCPDNGSNFIVRLTASYLDSVAVGPVAVPTALMYGTIKGDLIGHSAEQPSTAAQRGPDT